MPLPRLAAAHAAALELVTRRLDGSGGLAGFDERFDQSGGVPLGGHHIMPFAFEPVFEKLPLGGLAGAVGTLKRDQ